MSFASLKIPSLAQPLIPKSLSSYEEKLQSLLEDLHSAVTVFEARADPALLQLQAVHIRDIGQAAREQLAALEKQPRRIYEDEKQKKIVIRRCRTELSRLLLQFERKMSTLAVQQDIEVPASGPAASEAIFSPADYDRERGEELRNINSSLAQIHVLLKEFSRAVSDQGKTLVEVTDHVEGVTGHAQAGLQEVTKTLHKQEEVSLGVKLALALILFLLLAGAVAWGVDYANSDTQ